MDGEAHSSRSFQSRAQGPLRGAEVRLGSPPPSTIFIRFLELSLTPPPKHNGHRLLPGMGKLWGVREHPEREETPHLECGSSLCFQLQTNESSKKKRRGENWKLKAEDEETINSEGGKRSAGLPGQHGVP